MHADRTNRGVLLLFAVVLTTTGGLGTALSVGLFGTAREHRKITHNAVWKYYGQHGDWLWPVTALAALILLLLALRWLQALLFSTDRTGDLQIPSQPGTGKTTLTPAALTAAVGGDIAAYRGISSAKSRLIGDPDDPRLIVTVTIEDSADLLALRHKIETRALAHARQAMGNPNLPIQLDLNVTTKRSTRVV